MFLVMSMRADGGVVGKHASKACVQSVACALGMVMAGTGDLDALRMLRRLRAPTDTHFGMSLGSLLQIVRR